MADDLERLERYRLDDQVGYLMRRASQRHLAIFQREIPELTPRQFAALARLAELGPVSQNRLGREASMDAATVKGVIDRLAERGLVAVRADPTDRRLRIVEPTAEGVALFRRIVPRALAVSAGTLGPLAPAERTRLLGLLAKLG